MRKTSILSLTVVVTSLACGTIDPPPLAAAGDSDDAPSGDDLTLVDGVDVALLDELPRIAPPETDDAEHEIDEQDIVGEEPVIDEPVLDEPVLDEDIVDDEPVIDEPAIDEPINDAPVTEEPVDEPEPIVEEVSTRMRLAYEMETLDLDSGTIAEDDMHGPGNGNAGGWDVKIAYNSVSAVHAVVFQNQQEGVQIAHVTGLAFADVDAAVAASAAFTTNLVGDSFDAQRVLLVRTATGGLFKLGNGVETADFGFAFDVVELN